MGKGIDLLHGQGIHVGAQTNGTLASAAFKNADHTGLTQTTVDLNTPFGQLFCHHVGSANFFKTQLGVGVNVASNGRQTGRLQNDVVNQFHGFSLAAGVCL